MSGTPSLLRFIDRMESLKADRSLVVRGMVPSCAAFHASAAWMTSTTAGSAEEGGHTGVVTPCAFRRGKEAAPRKGAA